jgi:mannobiose 2-epimerase
MVDADSGGWFHRLDRTGKSVETPKHIHGFAYAISACVAVYTTTRNLEALKLAREGFDWVIRYARDHQHGGYFGYLRRDGSVIRECDHDSPKCRLDTLGSPLGCKDINVHSDLLQSFNHLYRVAAEMKVKDCLWEETEVKDRLLEIVDIVSNRMAFAQGAVYQYCLADWMPVPHLTRFGYQFQNATRLIEAAQLLGEEVVLTPARQFVDHALRYGYDWKRGGFFYAGPGLEPLHLQGKDLRVQEKAWWVQMEALKALLAVHSITPNEEHYFNCFMRQWRYLQDHFLDYRYDGFYITSLEGLPWWQRQRPRWAPTTITRKGSDWKDSSHDGRALLYCISLLQNQLAS